MHDVLQLVLGSLVSGVWYLVGVAVGRRSKNTAVKAECPCGHSISFHEGLTGLCKAEDENSVHVKGLVDHYEWVPCRCQRYAGPELISSFTMRPIAELGTTTDDPRQLDG